jgi:uncharacterized protein (TIGR02611 family)
VSRNLPEDDPKPAKVGNSDTAGEDHHHDRRSEHIRSASAAAFRRVEARTPPSIATRLRRVRERIRQHRSLDTVWRVMVFAIGCTLMAAGLAMFLLPGPGWATLILGLVVLASEFTWANRVLDPVKEAAMRAKNAAMDPRRRRRNLILSALAGVLIGIGLVWYLLVYGPTLDPVMQLSRDILEWFTSLFD